MHVALYARYSSEHQREASIADQFRTCEQSAQSQGWTVSHRYEDKAISGSRADRPSCSTRRVRLLRSNQTSRLLRPSWFSIRPLVEFLCVHTVLHAYV